MILVQHTYQPGEDVTVDVRPEMVTIDPQKAHTKGVVTQEAYLGNHIEYVVDVQGQTLELMESDPRRMTVHPEGAEVGLRFIEECLYVFPKLGLDWVDLD